MDFVSIRSSTGTPTTPIDWQRDGGAKHVIGIRVPLGFDEPFGIATEGLRCAFYVAPGEQIGMSTRKRHGIEGCTSSLR